MSEARDASASSLPGSPGVIDARLVSDTRAGGGRNGVRQLGLAERRLLFEVGDAFLELRLPAEATVVEDGNWIHGQFVVPDESIALYRREIFVVLQNESGVTGAVRTQRSGEFSLPFSGTGRFVLDVETPAGRVYRASFTP